MHSTTGLHSANLDSLINELAQNKPLETGFDYMTGVQTISQSSIEVSLFDEDVPPQRMIRRNDAILDDNNISLVELIRGSDTTFECRVCEDSLEYLKSARYICGDLEGNENFKRRSHIDLIIDLMYRDIELIELYCGLDPDSLWLHESEHEYPRPGVLCDSCAIEWRALKFEDWYTDSKHIQKIVDLEDRYHYLQKAFTKHYHLQILNTEETERVAENRFDYYMTEEAIRNGRRLI